MKVLFRKVACMPVVNLDIYNSINRIPFSLRVNFDDFSDVIYARNLYLENFIEFRFNKESKVLMEITLVSVQEKVGMGNVILKEFTEMYECYLNDCNELNMSVPLDVFYFDGGIGFSWGRQSSDMYHISSNCILGVDEEKNLSFVSLINLEKNEIKAIIGK